MTTKVDPRAVTVNPLTMLTILILFICSAEEGGGGVRTTVHAPGYAIRYFIMGSVVQICYSGGYVIYYFSKGSVVVYSDHAIYYTRRVVW